MKSMSCFSVVVLINLWACTKTTSYDPQLTSDELIQVLVDIELAKAAVAQQPLLAPDSLMSVYMEAIASRYGLDAYGLEEELRLRLVHTDSSARWYGIVADSIKGIDVESPLE